MPGKVSVRESPVPGKVKLPGKVESHFLGKSVPGKGQCLAKSLPGNVKFPGKSPPGKFSTGNCSQERQQFLKYP